MPAVEEERITAAGRRRPHPERDALLLPDEYWARVLPKNRTELFPVITGAVLVLLAVACWELLSLRLPAYVGLR